MKQQEAEPTLITAKPRCRRHRRHYGGTAALHAAHLQLSICTRHYRSRRSTSDERRAHGPTSLRFHLCVAEQSRQRPLKWFVERLFMGEAVVTHTHTGPTIFRAPTQTCSRAGRSGGEVLIRLRRSRSSELIRDLLRASQLSLRKPSHSHYRRRQASLSPSPSSSTYHPTRCHSSGPLGTPFFCSTLNVE